MKFYMGQKVRVKDYSYGQSCAIKTMVGRVSTLPTMTKPRDIRINFLVDIGAGFHVETSWWHRIEDVQPCSEYTNEEEIDG
jgi:hypothetical protein